MISIFLKTLSAFVLASMLSVPSFALSEVADGPSSTVVIYNANDLDSKDIADFYCQARGVNPSHEIALAAPLSEEISRSDFDLTLARPLREEFVQRGYWMISKDIENRPSVVATQIRYVVLIRGVPLKIKECESYPGDRQIQPPPVGTCNASSVDSELSVLGLFTSQISGVVNNPCYQKTFDPSSKTTPPPSLLMVARLDAPTSKEVKSMISAGLTAERVGLWGWGYIDLRSVGTGSYVEGDLWIKNAGDALRREGIPVITDDLPDTFPAGFPVTDASAYYGWYSENIDGPFADPMFQFVPGAVAFHLHSFSAATLRDPTKGWAAPFIVHGAAASLGNVYEPYLTLTTDLGVMCQALISGRNLAESFYASQPVLSWMSVLLGDPLYRPYAMLCKTVATPTDYRSIILNHGGNVLNAAHDLVVKARSTHESLYLEALGAAQMDAGYLASAETCFKDASKLAKDPRVTFRLLLEQARALEKEGDPLQGASLLRRALSDFTSPKERELMLLWIARMDPPKPSPSASSGPTHSH